MRKIKYLMFILVFTVFIGIDLVKADYTIYYSGCCNLESDRDAVFDKNTSKVIGQSIKNVYVNKYNIYECNDDDFGGWKAYGYEGCNQSSCLDYEKYEFEGLFQPLELNTNFVNKNGDIFDGNIYLNAVDKNGNKKDTGNCSSVTNNNNLNGNNSNTSTTNNSNGNSSNTNNNDKPSNVDINTNKSTTITTRENCATKSFENCNDGEEHYCVANEEYKFCSNNGLVYLSCGDAFDIPEMVPKLTSFAVTFLKTAVPIILIIVSIIQLVKAITAGKEDEMKKAQNSLIKKIIAAAIVFFIVSIVQFIMLKVAADDAEKSNLSSCLSCFLNGTNKCNSLYFKDGYGYCYTVDGHNKFKCGVN